MVGYLLHGRQCQCHSVTLCPLAGDAELKVTRGLGNFNLEPGFSPQPHVSAPIDLCPASGATEFVIMASDGLWDKVSDEEVSAESNQILQTDQVFATSIHR